VIEIFSISTRLTTGIHFLIDIYNRGCSNINKKLLTSIAMDAMDVSR
jgi:hypothetical protein